MGKGRTIDNVKLRMKHMLVLALAAIACVFALSFASGADVGAADDAAFFGPQIAWADEQAPDASSDEADDQSDDSDAVGAEEGEEEEIEDEEVPLAMAVSVGKNLHMVIIGGLAIGIVLFIVLYHRTNRNINRMRSTFR